MITKEMIKLGYKQGIVELVSSPNSDGIVCRIGDNWFYFGSFTAAEYESVEEYKRDIPTETIVNEILAVLEDFKNQPENKDEYDYYDAYLQEKLDKLYDVLNVHIPNGRIRLMPSVTGEYRGIWVAVSDKAVDINEPHTEDELLKDQNIEPVMFIQVDTAAQARAWARTFISLESKIRNKANEMT